MRRWPSSRKRSAWQFTTLSIVRVAKAKRLVRDLGLNLPGVALALDLLDQLHEVRAVERQKEVAPRLYSVPCPPLHQLQRGASIRRNCRSSGYDGWVTVRTT
jgi:hypothetical protein